MINQLKQIAKKSNCKVGAKYPVLNVERKTDTEFVINGHTIYMHMDGNYSSNPPVNDAVLKNRINQVLVKMKRCSSGKLCSPTAEFGMIEKCTICKRLC